MRLEDITALADAMWAEARGDGTRSMRAVGHTIMNRSTVAGITPADAAYAKGQFSGLMPGDVNRQKLDTLPPDDPDYQKALSLATEIAAGKSIDTTKGATYYHTKAVNPDWAGAKGFDKVATIGSHQFYTAPPEEVAAVASKAPVAPPQRSSDFIVSVQDTIGAPVDFETGEVVLANALPGSPADPMSPPGAFHAASMTVDTSQYDPKGRYGKSATKNAEDFGGIVYHHTGPVNETLEEAVAYGQRPDPFRGGQMGYHAYVGKDGRVVQGAPTTARTNHILPDKTDAVSNKNAFGISLVGNGTNITPEQRQAAAQMGLEVATQYGVPVSDVFGHGDIQTSKGTLEGVQAREDLVRAMNMPGVGIAPYEPAVAAGAALAFDDPRTRPLAEINGGPPVASPAPPETMVADAGVPPVPTAKPIEDRFKTTFNEVAGNVPAVVPEEGGIGASAATMPEEGVGPVPEAKPDLLADVAPVVGPATPAPAAAPGGPSYDPLASVAPQAAPPATAPPAQAVQPYDPLASIASPPVEAAPVGAAPPVPTARPAYAEEEIGAVPPALQPQVIAPAPSPINVPDAVSPIDLGANPPTPRAKPEKDTSMGRLAGQGFGGVLGGVLTGTLPGAWTGAKLGGKVGTLISKYNPIDLEDYVSPDPRMESAIEAGYSAPGGDLNAEWDDSRFWKEATKNGMAGSERGIQLAMSREQRERAASGQKTWADAFGMKDGDTPIDAAKNGFKNMVSTLTDPITKPIRENIIDPIKENITEPIKSAVKTNVTQPIKDTVNAGVSAVTRPVGELTKSLVDKATSALETEKVDAPTDPSKMEAEKAVSEAVEKAESSKNETASTSQTDSGNSDSDSSGSGNPSEGGNSDGETGEKERNTNGRGGLYDVKPDKKRKKGYANALQGASLGKVPYAI